MSRRLSPLDIQHATFTRRLGGYDRKEVGDFLERLSHEVEASLREIQGLRQQLIAAEERMAELKTAEAELQRAVVAAERVATDMKELARREAEHLLKEAERERRERLAGADEQVARARADLSRLERERALFKEQFRGLLTAYLRGLDAHVPEPQAAEAEGAKPEERASTALLDDSVQP